jgi:Zn-dependent protease
MDPDFLALGVLWYVVFLLSTTCHEAAHALAAKLGGDLTAFHGGQVSLDPWPHMRREPFGMILFPLLSYFGGGWMMGWASAPYDPRWSYRYPKRAAWMSLAGPGANFTLALLAGIAIRVGMIAGAFVAPDSLGFSQLVSSTSPGVMAAVAKLLSILFSLNLLLGTFNLLPIPPLDGFSAMGLVLSEGMARKLELWAQQYRMFTVFGLLLSWQIFPQLYWPIFGLALRVLYPAVQYGV